MPEPDDLPEPPRLRQLRLLVSALLLTLIVGFVIIVASFVLHLRAAPAPLALPERIALPEGERPGAVTLGRDWIALVTTDASGRERIRIFDRRTGAERTSLDLPSPSGR